MRVKYPRTFHLPWSLGATDDDKTHSVQDIGDMFDGREVVITEKVDGENSTLYADGGSHARSLDSAHHPSRSWVKSHASTVGPELPGGWRVCGENMFARHSISYEELPSYFLAFSIWTDDNVCLGWDEFTEWCTLLGLAMVPVLYRGVWDASKAQTLWPRPSSFGGGESEGYVVRLADAFPYSQFKRSVAKFVRANHVQTDTHWMHASITPNGLK